MIPQPMMLLPTLAHSIAEIKPPVASAQRVAAVKGAAAGRLAYVEIVGVLTPDVMAPLRSLLLDCADDPSIREVLIYANSPGGTVAGGDELSQAVARVANAKPVHAFIEDFGCSGCYYAIAGATSITASPTALVGSIGVAWFLLDDSEAFARDGMKVIPIATGDLKATGAPGVPVTEKMVAMLEGLCQSALRGFHLAILQGRKGKIDVKQLMGMSTGEVWYGDEAQRRGLVDGVAIYEDWLAERRQQNPPPAPTGAAAAAEFTRLADAALSAARVDEEDDDYEPAWLRAVQSVKSSHADLANNAAAHGCDYLDDLADGEPPYRSRYSSRK